MQISKKQIRVTIALIVIFVVIIFYVISISPLYEKNEVASKELTQKIGELTKPPEACTYQIPLYFSFNGTSPFLNASETDFGFLLTVTYPNGTLFPNDIVHINATAQIDNSIERLDHVGIIFPNTLRCPVTFGDNHFPLQGILQFSNPVAYSGGQGVTFHNIYTISEIDVKWITEGDYKPLIGFFFKDGTNLVYPTTNWVIHVYPEEQRIQRENNVVSLKNNQANLELSKAVYWLSAVAVVIAVIALAVQIVGYDDKINDARKQTANKYSYSHFENKRRQIPTVRINKKDNKKKQSAHATPN